MMGIEAVSIERDDSGWVLSKRHSPSMGSDSSPRWSVEPLKNLLICLSLKVLRSHVLRWQKKIKNFEIDTSSRQTRPYSKELVAVTGADGDLVTALGAATAENSGSCLCLHAGKKAVGLGAMAAIWLESTLRHDKKLLRRVEHLLKLLGCCNNL